ncbi:retrovirus-related pol polyprotein from transposon TNT 1-94 [Tanacetum coccineum]
MACASPICLMARATSTKSWLWHQRLSNLNFDTINDLAKNDLVTGLPKFKYHKEHLCPLCEQGKSKRASHPPKPVSNSKSKDEAPEAEAIATACYTQNRSIIYCRFNKTPYELINGRKPDISFLHVFGALCYPKNDRKDIGKLGAKAYHDDYIGGQPSAAPRTGPATQAPQVLQTPTATTTTIDTAPTPKNSSS